MPQNVETYPAVVLQDDNSNIEAYGQYTDQIKEKVLYKRQQDELAKAKLDESLMPPEIDMKDIFPGDALEINKAMQDYKERAMNYADRGIDWNNDPVAGRERTELESKIQDLVLMSKQDQALAKNLIDKASQDGFDNDFLRAESYDRFGQFKAMGEKGGIHARQRWLKQNGSLLQEKPFDVNAFMEDYTKDIDTDFVIEEKVKPGAPGYNTQQRKFWLAPEEVNGRTQVMLNNPKFREVIVQRYASLSPAEQRLLVDQAQMKGYSDARQVLAEQELKKYVMPKNEIKDLKKPTPKGGGSGSSTKKDDASETQWLLQKLGNARGGNTDGLSQTYINGQEYYTLDLPQFDFDKYTEYVPAVEDPATGQVVKAAEQKSVPERIEELIYDPRSGKWYAYTNKTTSKKISKGNSPKPYGYEMNDLLWTKLFRGIIANNSGTNKFSAKDAEEILKELKATTDTGDINWDNIAPAKSQPKQTLPTKTKTGEGTKTETSVDASLYQ